jgi:hypothetical protein
MPGLAAFFDEIARRPSFTATVRPKSRSEGDWPCPSLARWRHFR